jgi:hypothetical protein
MKTRKPVALSWQAATLDGLTTENASWANYTLRQSILSALIPAAFTQVRFSVRGGIAEGITITNAYIGIRGAGAYDFAATPTPVLWGGSASKLAAIGTTEMCDPVTLTRAAGEDIVIAFFMGAGTGANDTFFFFGTGSARNYSAKYKSGGNDAATLVASGYSATSSAFSLFLDDFEVM